MRTILRTTFIGILGLGLAGCGGEDASEPTAETALVLCNPSKSGQVAANPDGNRIAYVSCARSEPAVVVFDLETETETELGDASLDASAAWLLDGETVLVSSTEEFWLRAADASEPAVDLAEGEVLSYRAFRHRADKDGVIVFDPRLLVVSQVDDTRRISLREPDTGYREPTILLEDSEVEADLSLISDSGRTLILTPTDLESGYRQVQWKTAKAAWEAASLSFGPSDWSMAPVGLGDQHDFATFADRLVRVKLEDGAITELVPAGTGLLEGTHHLYERESAPGTKDVYYIQNGDPTFQAREGSEAQVLAEANAVAQVMTPDQQTLLYLSDGILFGVPATGGSSRALVENENTSNGIDLVFAAGPESAYFLDGAIYRVPLEEEGAAVRVSTSPALQGQLAYDGKGQAILFRSESGALVRVPAGSEDEQIVEESVQAYWPLPKSESVLVAIENELVRIDFPAP